MVNLKQKLGLTPLNSKKICMLGMLTAITLILGMYATIRIGEGIKISFKFISVFLTASLFGPLWAGAVCVMSDILAYLVNPVGAFMPLITLCEFMYGFFDGIFYYNNGKNMVLKIILCTTLEIVLINIFLTSYFLIPVMGLSYSKLIILRLPMAGINYAVRIITLIFLDKYFVSSGLKGRLR